MGKKSRQNFIARNSASHLAVGRARKSGDSILESVDPEMSFEKYLALLGKMSSYPARLAAFYAFADEHLKPGNYSDALDIMVHDERYPRQLVEEMIEEHYTQHERRVLGEHYTRSFANCEDSRDFSGSSRRVGEGDGMDDILDLSQED